MPQASPAGLASENAFGRGESRINRSIAPPRPILSLVNTEALFFAAPAGKTDVFVPGRRACGPSLCCQNCGIEGRVCKTRGPGGPGCHNRSSSQSSGKLSNPAVNAKGVFHMSIKMRTSVLTALVGGAALGAAMAVPAAAQDGPRPMAGSRSAPSRKKTPFATCSFSPWPRTARSSRPSSLAEIKGKVNRRVFQITVPTGRLLPRASR